MIGNTNSRSFHNVSHAMKISPHDKQLSAEKQHDVWSYEQMLQATANFNQNDKFL